MLAGGQSSRMGTDKAMVRFKGEPLIAHALGILRPLCADVRIAGGDSALAAFAPLVPDNTRFLGPLGGIVAALEASNTDWGLFIPVDIPFLPAEALHRLVEIARRGDAIAVLSRPLDHTNPLVALYHRRALPVLSKELAAGRLKVRAAVEAAGPVSYAEFTQPEEQSWFRNLNTPADLTDAPPWPGR